MLAAREQAKALAGLAEAHDEVDLGQRGEVTERVQAPEGEGFGLRLGEVKRGEGKRREMRGFFAGRDVARRTASGGGHAEGGVQVGAGGDMREEA